MDRITPKERSHRCVKVKKWLVAGTSECTKVPPEDFMFIFASSNKGVHAAASCNLGFATDLTMSRVRQPSIDSDLAEFEVVAAESDLGSFEQLPVELFVYLFSFLNVNEISNLFQCSKRMNVMMRCELLLAHAPSHLPRTSSTQFGQFFGTSRAAHTLAHMHIYTLMTTQRLAQFGQLVACLLLSRCGREQTEVEHQHVLEGDLQAFAYVCYIVLLILCYPVTFPHFTSPSQSHAHSHSHCVTCISLSLIHSGPFPHSHSQLAMGHEANVQSERNHSI